MSILSEKVVLITGGTGSFGKTCAKLLLKKYSIKKLIIYSRDELKQSEMAESPDFQDDKVRLFIGDIRDKQRLDRALSHVDIVIHTAALKQVPSCEYNPIEAVRTNVIGAQNLIDAALSAGVQRVIALSTDKAVNPINLYGASKLVADKLFVAGNVYRAPGGTTFSSVRYGNVLGSRGSVLPRFLEQRRTGTITITDERMTRFWITLEQGVDFVLSCLEKMVGGEIFIPKIPSMKIMELAEVVAPDCKRQVVGIRPGEKLHEVLLTADDARHSLEYDDHFVIYPEPSSWTEDIRNKLKKGKSLKEGFNYASDTNDRWLSREELKAFVQARWPM